MGAVRSVARRAAPRSLAPTMTAPADGFPARVIGRVRTTFATRHAAPRQARLAPLVDGVVEIDVSYRHALTDLSGFSYVWLVCWLDRPDDPRGGEALPVTRADGSTVGLFATRSPIRPTP